MYYKVLHLPIHAVIFDFNFYLELLLMVFRYSCCNIWTFLGAAFVYGCFFDFRDQFFSVVSNGLCVSF